MRFALQELQSVVVGYALPLPGHDILTPESRFPLVGVVSWKQCLSDNQAWDTLTWFAALIAMAAYLNKFGFISWFSDQVRPVLRCAVLCGD